MEMTAEKEFKRLERDIKAEYDEYFETHRAELVEDLTPEQVSAIEEICPARSVKVIPSIGKAEEAISVGFKVQAVHEVFAGGDPIVFRVESAKKNIPEIVESLFTALVLALEAIPTEGEAEERATEIARQYLEETHMGE